MSTQRRFAHALLAGLLLLAAPLFAQINPASAWAATKTDFLDLYRGRTTGTLKPEILMVIDSSGSTNDMMYHALYPNNWKEEAPPAATATQRNIYLLIRKITTGVAADKNHYVVDKVGFGPQGSQGLTTSQSGTGYSRTYTIGGSRATYAVSGKNYPINTLIKPDGTEVNFKDANNLVSDITGFQVPSPGTTTQEVDILNWVHCASHVRMQCTHPTTGKVRTIDFPLNWAVLNPSVRTFTKGPVPRQKAHNPKDGADYDIDTTYLVTVPDANYGDGYLRYYPSTNHIQAECGQYGLGGSNPTAWLYRPSYIEWAFWGIDGKGAYFVPNAIPSTDSTVLYSLDPTSLTLDYTATNAYAYNAPYTYTYLTSASASPAGTLASGQADPYVGIDAGKLYNATDPVGWCPAFWNGMPNRSRIQAMKEAALATWFNNQDEIYMAYRFLGSTQAGNTIATGAANDSTNWTYCDTTNGGSMAAMTGLVPASSTPLRESQTSGYCQMTNPAAFMTLESGTLGLTDTQRNCLQHFMILATDGAPSSIQASEETNPSSFPYQAGAKAGNASLVGTTNMNKINGAGQAYWNVPTLAGIAAHGGCKSFSGTNTTIDWIRDPSTALSGTSPSGWIPFWVQKRNSTYTLTTPHPIQTMTLGVSLGVNWQKNGTDWTTGVIDSTYIPKPIQTDYTAAKFRLLMAAMVGDPRSTSYTAATIQPFHLDNGQQADNTAYYFDGRDPQTLVDNLASAIDQIKQISQTNTTAAPVFPAIGAGLGAEVYISKFLPPLTSGPLWTGDMRMFPTKDTSTGTSLIDSSSGNVLSGDLDAATPGWSASDALIARGWSNRVIYTRLPAPDDAHWNPALTRINLGATGNNVADAGYAAILSLLPGTSLTKLGNWQYFAGADTSGSTAPLPTRATIMGDIISSTPTALEYTSMPSGITSTVLRSAWSLHGSTGGSADKTGHFRMIFVGSNQGFFHAFGEVSWIDATSNAAVPITKGVVDEVWAFVPTDILPYINQLGLSSNAMHRFTVDGAPTVYLLDRPQTSTQTAGNGMFDLGATNPERAVVIFGLGKGGRSYYAIDVADPSAPAMKWALCPDEVHNYPTARIKSGSATVIANMGLSTSIPTIARVATDLEGAPSNKIVDVVLLGGGYSDLNIETALPGTPAGPAKNTLLGRSALAIEVTSGDILNTWDLSGTSGTGPVITGVVPHVLVPGAGVHHRAYLTDYYGGLWALGSTANQGTIGGVDFSMFRLDSPKIDNWTARQVYAQPVVAGAAGNGLISTLPVPFNLPGFPVVRTTTPKISPGAVAIAFVTGDRNNPVDDYSKAMWLSPTQHRLNVVFDRQDKSTVINYSSGMSDAGSSSFVSDSTNASFYLNSTFGYYQNFDPRGSGTFTEKGIIAPTLLNGVLFYSFFNPTTSTCAGGTGTTSTFRICNVMKPTASSSTTWNATDASTATAVNGCSSGMVLAWSGVASTISVRSILSGVQAGLTSASGVTNDPSGTQSLKLQNLPTQGTEAFAKVRVWRTVH
jgi:hypothetical protein